MIISWEGIWEILPQDHSGCISGIQYKYMYVTSKLHCEAGMSKVGGTVQLAGLPLAMQQILFLLSNADTRRVHAQ